MPDLPLLWHFPISHYAEKVRWALDYKGIAHRRQVLSGDNVLRVRWATGRRSTLPVLHLAGRAIVDSTDIIAALEEHRPEPPLYPRDPAQRERALALEDWLDEEVGHPVRTLLVPALMQQGPQRISDTLMSGMDSGTRRMFRLIHPIFRRFYFARHGIADASRRAAPGIVQGAFDRLAGEVGPSGYLVGDAFGVADLTAASLLAPLVRPEGTLWAGLGTLPDEVERVLQPLTAHPVAEWVSEVYARHRGESAEVAH
ncbi:MAG: glutathione S-transferase family protein [Myxococcota bacterium]